MSRKVEPFKARRREYGSLSMSLTDVLTLRLLSKPCMSSRSLFRVSESIANTISTALKFCVPWRTLRLSFNSSHVILQQRPGFIFMYNEILSCLYFNFNFFHQNGGLITLVTFLAPPIVPFNCLLQIKSHPQLGIPARKLRTVSSTPGSAHDVESKRPLRATTNN